MLNSYLLDLKKFKVVDPMQWGSGASALRIVTTMERISV